MRNHNILPYTQDARKLASELRKNLTPAEKLFWGATKSAKLGFTMRRQMPILDYVVDFYIKEVGLAIELDGSAHDHNALEDGIRQARIEKLGVNFIRFSNKQVINDLPFVLKELNKKISELKG